MKRAVPSDLAWLSLRRTRALPISWKVLGSFSRGVAGGATLPASGSNSAKVAVLPDAWPTTLLTTVTCSAGTFHLAAAAATNMARAAAPTVRSCIQELAMAEEPPVP